MKSTISKILRHFKLSVAEDYDSPKLVAELVLRPSNGIKLKLNKRTYWSAKDIIKLSIHSDVTVGNFREPWNFYLYTTVTIKLRFFFLQSDKNNSIKKKLNKSQWFLNWGVQLEWWNNAKIQFCAFFNFIWDSTTVLNRNFNGKFNLAPSQMNNPIHTAKLNLKSIFVMLNINSVLQKKTWLETNKIFNSITIRNCNGRSMT